MNMSLTTGRGPFGTRPAGHFNQAMPELAGLLYLEPFAPRIRGLVGEQTVLDSTSSWMLHEHGQLQVLYFPTADVRMDLLAPNGVRSRSPGKGEAAHYRLAVGDRIVEEAAWTFPDPEMDGLAGLIAFISRRCRRGCRRTSRWWATPATRTTASTSSTPLVTSRFS